MATVIATDLDDVLERILAAALAGPDDDDSGVHVVDPEFVGVVLPASDQPMGEQCDSVVVYLLGLQPIADPAECSLIWDAQIGVRLDLCVGAPDNNGAVSADEQEARAERFYSLFWAMLAGLTGAWREGEIPYPDQVNGCQKLTWGPATAPVEEGGIISARVQINVEISARYVVGS